VAPGEGTIRKVEVYGDAATDAMGQNETVWDVQHIHCPAPVKAPAAIAKPVVKDPNCPKCQDEQADCTYQQMCARHQRSYSAAND
jgi:hypothetical protein